MKTFTMAIALGAGALFGTAASAGNGAAKNFLASSGEAGFPLDQWARSSAIRVGLRPLDAIRRGRPD